MGNKEAEYHIGDGKHLTMKQTTTVSMKDQLRLMTGEGKGITLDVEIKADFDKIPTEYHQMFLQMLQIRYGGIVNLWDNTHALNPTAPKKRWWAFWKRN